MAEPRVFGLLQSPPDPGIAFTTSEDVATWHDYFLRQKEIIQQIINNILIGTIAVRDEGTLLTNAANSLDFRGTGVTATAVGDAVTVTIPGGPLTTQDEGTTINTDTRIMNFTGGGVTATAAGTTTTVLIPGSTGGFPPDWFWGSQEHGVVDFDGVNTFTGITKTGNTYRLDKCLFGSTVTIRSGITIHLGCFPIWAMLLDLQAGGLINGSGADAAGANAGIGGGGNNGPFFLGNTSAGTNGGIGGAASANTALQVTSISVGGRGGSAGAVNAGTIGSQIINEANGGRGILTSWAALNGQVGALSGNTLPVRGGGAGSGGASAAPGSTGGGGGGGSAVILLICKEVMGGGQINSRGGNGAPGQAGNAGGGGGGGGGWISIWTTTDYVTLGLFNLDVSAGIGGAGIGTGNAGANGGVGLHTAHIFT